MVKSWLFYSFLALLLWGLWAFFPRFALESIDAKSVYLLQMIGAFVIGAVILVSLKFQVQVTPKGAFFAILSGIAGTLGFLFFLYAISSGNPSIVVPLTALYPLIAITLAVAILRDPVTLKQGIGIAFALISIALLST